ncbi:ketopantoate reductase PanE/ApbA C terminal-domain-containing protein [Fennellomyces sp. T-0311]|nr:ketopantoate reductase PanE/ApbA C terminal-domain-containing protein [Fennellomyces sp. T-0311]
MQFYILGAGAVGCQIATALRSNHHDVTLILRTAQAVQDFYRQGSKIIYQRIDQKPIRVGGFHAVTANNVKGPLKTVIVTTKSLQALEAVKSIKSALSPSTTLVLLQNGMGLAEELLSNLWPGVSKAYSPSFIIGVNRHSVWRRTLFSIQHNSGWTSPEEGIFLTLTNTPDLNATAVEWSKLRVLMMRKLVVNGSISVVAKLLECKNGLLLDNPYALGLIRGICDEAAQVLTELNTTGDDLYKLVQQSIVVYGPHVCSMLQDLMAKRPTEADYITGQICRLAAERNINVPTNRLLLDLIHAKETHACLGSHS